MLPAKDVLVAYAFALPSPVQVVEKLPDVLERNLSLLRDSFLLSNLFIPHKFQVLISKFYLIVMSSGLSGDKLGDRLTSTSHGLRSESRSISKPKTSKQLSLYI